MRVERTIVADRGAAEPVSLGAALASGRKVAPDVFALLVMDHVEARSFFERYDRETTPERRLSVARRLCRLLQVHMQVEEEIVYPAAAQAAGDDEMVRHAVQEHAEGRPLIEQVLSGQAEGAALDDCIGRLRQIIEHHVEEEETRFFPQVRESGGLDVYGLGAETAARRLELLIQTIDRPLEEDGMQAGSDMSVGRAVNLSDSAAEPIDPAEARRLFIVGLKNAHAALTDGRAMAQRQVERVESYPKLKARMQAHLREADDQLQRVDSILDRLGERPSGLKDAMMGLAGNAGALTNAMAGDEVLKNSLADAAMTQMMIASYQSLIVMGEAAGEIDAIRLLKQSLDEERSMAAWLEENLRGTVLAHLQLRSLGEQAKH